MFSRYRDEGVVHRLRIRSIGSFGAPGEAPCSVAFEAGDLRLRGGEFTFDEASGGLGEVRVTVGDA